MIKIFDCGTGDQVGTITVSQLRVLVDLLEEESIQDKDYYINRATLDFFESRDVDPELMTVLRRALGDREEMEIRWSAP